MTFTLTYRDLNNSHFLPGVRKIANYGFKDIKLSYNASRIGSLLDTELKTHAEMVNKLRKKAKALKPAADATEEEKAAAEVEFAALKLEAEQMEELSFTLERHKIKFADLEGTGLTANEIRALEPLLEGLPE